MKIILKILNWIFSLFCLCVLPIYGFHIGSIVIFVLGIITLPIKFFSDLRRKIPINRFVKIGIYIVIFFIGILILPTENTTQKTDKKTENIISTENNKTEKYTSEQTTEESTTEVQTTEKQITEKQTTEVQTTEEPTTEKQTTEVQTTEEPITEEITAEEWTSEAQTTEAQNIEEQTSEEKTTEEQTTEQQITELEQVSTSYVLNTNTGKFHKLNCSTLGTMNDANREDYYGTRDEVINMGYSPCGRCNP